MNSTFSRFARWLTYFLVGLCGALLLAVISLSQTATAVDRLPAAGVSGAPAQTAPVSQFALETAATHQAANFYQ